MPGATRLARCTVERQLRSTISSSSSRSAPPAKAPPAPRPAFSAAAASGRPVARMRSQTRSTPAPSRGRRWTASTRAPCDGQLAAGVSSGSSLAVMTRSKLWLANCLASSRPMPVDAPVTRRAGVGGSCSSHRRPRSALAIVPAVFDHVTIRVSDRDGLRALLHDGPDALGFARPTATSVLPEWDDFSIAPAEAPSRVTHGLHIGFVAASRPLVDAFWRDRHRRRGYRDDGAPGPRPQYRDDYYGAFLLDPDGNSAEAVHHGDRARDGAIDHLWIRVADVAAAQRVLRDGRAASPACTRSSTRPTARTSTARQRLVLARRRDAEAQRPHRLPRRRRRDGRRVPRRRRRAPATRQRRAGERPSTTPGYYGAFVLDPDGNNIELVNHNR